MTWMSFENTLPSEIKQTRKDKYWGWLHSVVLGAPALHTEGPRVMPQVEPRTILSVHQALGALLDGVRGDAPPSETQFLKGKWQHS